MSALRIGTRASALALWQANRVSQLIQTQPGSPPVELVHIHTEGDQRTDVPLWALQGRAFFTKEIDRALLGGEIDIAVHSLKDMSTILEHGIELAAVLEREDPRDALVAAPGMTLETLPQGARVGTSSLRRRAFLTHARPDLKLMELRGNVPTRIDKLKRGEYDVVVLATAGLKRLGLDAHIVERLSAEKFPPAVSQGAIGVCAREGDKRVLNWLKGLDHAATRVATTAERSLLRRIEGGCQAPLGALATVEGTSLSLHAVVCSLDGSARLESRDAVAGQDFPGIDAAKMLGERVAEQLLEKGAGRIIQQQRSTQSAAELP